MGRTDEVAVTLPKALYRRLRAKVRDAGLPLEWLVAALVAELADAAPDA